MSKKIVTYNNLKEFKSKYDQKIGITKGTLNAGSTSITLADSRITSNSFISVFVSNYAVDIQQVTINATNKTATITIPAQSTALTVGIVVLN